MIGALAHRRLQAIVGKKHFQGMGKATRVVGLGHNGTAPLPQGKARVWVWPDLHDIRPKQVLHHKWNNGQLESLFPRPPR